jgi:hypothetical protein
MIHLMISVDEESREGEKFWDTVKRHGTMSDM